MVSRCFFSRGLALAAVLALSAHAAPKKQPAKPKAAEPKTVDIYRAQPAPAFDSVKVHKLYLEGDFDEAIDLLETAIREKKTFTHEDSVFFCKHLGVMYAAKYETREKGKYYMHTLLMVEPTAKILDMYASDMIYMIFKNIQEEFEDSRMRLTRAEGHVRGNAQGDSMPVAKTPPKQDPKVSEGHPWVWVGAGTALVAAGATTFFILNDKPATRHLDAQYPTK
jgi:hypothetical protein